MVWEVPLSYATQLEKPKTGSCTFQFDQLSFHEEDFGLLVRMKTVSLEFCHCGQDCSTISGFISVANIAFHKMLLL